MITKYGIGKVFDGAFQPGKNMYMHWLLIPFGLLVMPVLIVCFQLILVIFDNGFSVSTDTFVAQQMFATCGWSEHSPLPVGELLNWAMYLCMILGLYGVASLFVDIADVSTNWFKKQGDDL